MPLHNNFEDNMNKMPLMQTLGAHSDCGNNNSASKNFLAAKNGSPFLKLYNLLYKQLLLLNLVFLFNLGDF